MTERIQTFAENAEAPLVLGEYSWLRSEFLHEGV